jgi:hypothetical protein
VRRRLHRAGEDEVRQELGTVVLRLPQRRRAPAGETLRIGKILIWRRRLEDEQLTTLSVPKKANPLLVERFWIILGGVIFLDWVFFDRESMQLIFFFLFTIYESGRFQPSTQ